MGDESTAQNTEAGSVYDVIFTAEQLSVRAALADIRTALENVSVNADLLGRVETALAELFNNIVKHAYENSGSGTMRCEVTTSLSHVSVDVTDDGKPMPGHSLPDGDLPDLSVDFLDLPEGGFGWFIIKSQTDGLNYERQGSKNRTELRFDVGRHAQE